MGSFFALKPEMILPETLPLSRVMDNLNYMGYTKCFNLFSLSPCTFYKFLSS